MKTTIYITEGLLKEVEKRGQNRSLVITRDLERYYELLDRALKQVKLTKREACLITDVLNGHLAVAVSAKLLWAEVEDAIELDGVDKKWEVDGKKLVEKLKGLNELQGMALIDAAERFWSDSEKSGIEGDLEEIIAKYFYVEEDEKD